MKMPEFPVTITEGGVSAKVRKLSQEVKGKIYTRFVADFIKLGKRKQIARASFDEAKEFARSASIGKSGSAPHPRR